MVDLGKEVTDPSSTDLRSRSASISRLFMGVVILGANLLFGLRGLDIGSRVLIDTDGHMRYNRVIELVTGLNGWWDGWAHRANAPFGHSMHWTRPFDALLVTLAAPLAAVSGWSDGLYFASLLVGPLLHLALGGMVAWAARPLVGVSGSYLAGVGVAAQSGILSYATPGRPDHHILIVVLAVALLGAVIRLSIDQDRKWEVVGGLAAAAGLWVSTEFLAALAIAVAYLGWLAVKRVNHLPQFGTWFVLGTAIALVLERPPSEYLAIEYDRVSVVHLLLAVLVALIGVVLRVVKPGPSRRLAAFVMGAVASALLLRQLFPLFFAGPFAEVPAEVSTLWLTRVAELAPLWEAARHRFSDLALLIGTGAIGLGIGIVRLRREARRMEWILILCALAVFLALCIRSIRFAVYPASLGSIPIAAWAVERLAVRQGRSLLKSLRRVFVMSVVVVGMAYPFMIALAIEGPPREESTPTCDLKDIVAPLAAVIAGRRGQVVLASLDSGPELLYRLPVRVVADPYHRNTEGILDSYAAFSAADATALLDKHEVEYVLVCEHDPDREVYRPGGLYDQLVAKTPVEGLRQLELESGSPFRLYQRNLG